MKVPMLDLKPQYQLLRNEIQEAMGAICESQMFILGKPVTDFEAACAAYCGTAHCCGVSSGSDALLIALMCEGIGAGDEVITTPYTFFATVGAIARTGATPVFVDICPDTYCIDAARIEEKITPRTKAIIPVHLYGQMANMTQVMEIANKHHLVVIEDSAQAIGAEWNGRRAGSFGQYGCLSFFPSKNLGCFGDAGAVLTQDAERAQKLGFFRNHGMNPKYYHKYVGGNFRMDALQAAVLSVKLRHLDEWTARRQANAAKYKELFGQTPGIVLPSSAKGATRHVCNQFVVRILDGKRQKVWDGLKSADIGCDVYYPVPLHLQECFRSLGYREGDFPESERAARETLAIPVYPDLTEEQLSFVSDTIKALLQ